MKPFEEKIVKLTLDYNTFKTSATAAIGVMTKLKDSITNLGRGDTKNASKSIMEIADAAKVVDAGMETVAETTKRTSLAFGALKTMATGALLGIGNQLMTSVVSTLKKFTLDPVTDGFKEYELKMKSMQTIMTNSGESVEVVNGILNELNKYSDLTIYNFNDMTKAIGSLSTSGIDLNRASSAVKGFFNLAAGTGVEAARASSLLDTAMVQAIQIGKMDYQNWKQLQSAGMGGPKFRDALVANAQAMGIQVDLSEGFNESLKQGWATTEVMLNTLKQFEEDQSLLEAATKVRTFTQLMDTALESVGSGWAETWEIIVGDFNEATVLWSGVWNVLEPIIEASSAIRNGFIRIFKENNGIQAIVQSFANVYRFINQIAQAIGGGFTNSAGKLLEFLKYIPVALTYPFKLLELITRKIADIKIIPQVIGVAFKGLFSIFGLFGSAVLKVVDAIKWLYNWLGLVVDKTTAWVKSIPQMPVFKPLIDFINVIKAVKWKDFFPDKNPFQKFIDTLKTAKDTAIQPFLTALEQLKVMLKAFGTSIATLSLEPIKEWGKNSKEALLKQFTEARDGIKKLFTKEFWTTLWTDFKKSYEEAIKTIQTSVSLDAIKKSFENLKEAIGKIKIPSLGDVNEVFKGINFKWLTEAFKGVTVYADEVGNNLKDATKEIKWFNNAIETVNKFTANFKPTIDKYITNTIDALTKKFESFKPKFEEFKKSLSAENLVNTIKGWLQPLKEFNDGLDWSPIVRQIEDVKSAFGSLKDKLSVYVDIIKAFDLYKTIQNGVQLLIDAIGSFNKTNFNTAITDGMDLLGRVTDKTKSIMENFAEFMKTVFSKLGDWIVVGIKYTIDGLGMLWNGTKSVVKKIADFLGDYKTNLESIKKFFSDWRDKIKLIFGDAFSTENLIRGGVLTYIGFMIKGMYDFQKNSNGILGGIKNLIDGIADFPDFIQKMVESLTGFTNAITPGNILKIAGAIAILALAIKLISTIEGEKVKTTLALMATGIGSLLAVFGAVGAANKFGLGGGMIKSMAAISSIATAILVLAGAMKIFASIDSDQMSVALTGLAGTLGIVTLALVALSKMNATQVSISLKGIVGVATAVLILSKAVEAFAKIETSDLIKGGIATGLALGALALALKVIGNSNFKMANGLGIILLATAINMLVPPVKKMSELSLVELAKGLGGLVGILTAITVPLMLLGSDLVSGPKLLGAGLAMNMVAGALNLMLIPVSILGKMDLVTLAKGLGSMALMISGITLALTILSTNGGGAMLGAGAILLTAAALNALIPPMLIFGTLKLSTIAQGLTVMAIGLGLVVGAGYLAMGASVGLLAIAGAVGSLAIAGIAIGGALMAIVVVLEFFTSATKGSFDTLSENILHMFDVILGALPKFEEVAIAVIDSMLTVLETNFGRMVEAGFNLLISLLTGIRDNIYQIVDLSLDIIVQFAQGLIDNMDTLINTSIMLAVALIKGLAQGINENAEEFMEAVRQLMGSILLIFVEGLELVATTLFGWIPGVKGLAEDAGIAARDGIRDHFNLDSGKQTAEEAMTGVTDGILGKEAEAGSASQKVADYINEQFGSPDFSGTGTDAADDYISSIKNKEITAGGAGRSIGDAVNTGLDQPNYGATGSDAIADYAKGIDNQSWNASNKAKEVAKSAKTELENVNTTSSGEWFGQGFVNGIGNMWESAINKANSLGSSALNALNNAIGAASPSKLTTLSGNWFGQGLVIGMDNEIKNIVRSAFKMGSLSVEALNDSLNGSGVDMNSLIEDQLNLTPIITPQLDMSNINMDDFNRTFKVFSNNNFENVSGKKSTEGNIGNANTYNLHLHANGELPDSVIAKMAKRFDAEIKKINDFYYLNKGEAF